MAYDPNADQISTGFKGYAGVFAQRRKYDYSDKVIHKSRVHSKMVNMLSKNLTKMAVTELEPRIFEFTDENDVIAIAYAPTTGTTIELANVDAQMLQANDVLSVMPAAITAAPSLETIIVVSVGAKDGATNSGAGYTNVIVRRGGTPINITDETAYTLIWTSNSIAENAAGSQPRNKEPNYSYNYLRLYDKTAGESKDVENSQFYAKQFFSLTGEMTRKRDMLMRNINWDFYLGERNRETAEDGNYRHFTGGLYELIPSANKLSMSGVMTINYWNEKSSTTWFRYGNDRHEKFMFAGPAFLVSFENMYTQYYQLKVNEVLSKFYGVQVKSVEFSGGTLHFVREDGFLGTGYSNCAFIEDQDFVAYMYLANRDVQVDKDVTNPDEKWNKTKWKIFGRLGFFRSYSTAHHFLYNPSAPA